LAIAAWYRQNQGEPGFKELVKNPELWEEMDEGERETEAAIQESKSWSEARIAAEVRRFIFEGAVDRDVWLEKRVLAELEPSTHAAVVEILMEKELHGKLLTPVGKDALKKSPFERACDLFGETAPPEAVDAVAPFLGNAKARIRQAAALVLGKAATEDAIPYLRTALTHEDEYVRYSALKGLRFAVSGKRVPRAVAESLFAEVSKLVEDGTNGPFAANLLPDFDAEKARVFFLSPAVFSAESKALGHVLEVMAGAQMAAPRETLLALIANLESKPTEQAVSVALGDALHLLGGQGRQEDAAFLKARMTHADEDVAEGAAAGMLSLAGLDGYEERVWKAEETGGYEALPMAQRYFLAVRLLDGEVGNGGFAQYFLNPTGNQWKEAIAGLEAMGSKQKLAAVRDAVAVFGPSGPSPDREARKEELSRIYRKNDSAFETMEDRYYESGEVLQVLVTNYVIKQAEQFR
jgi:hypothetical protein